MTVDDVSRTLGLVGRHAPAILASAPADVVMWTGAGISADLPTGAPIGYELVDRVFDHAFAPGTLRVIQRYYACLRIDRSRPRLEAVLDVVRHVLGLPVLVDLLGDLRDPPPNGLHRFFAAHLASGGRHITANFDPCIESAASGPSPPVLHFHGSFAEHPDGDELGATLARIDRGLPEDIAQRLTDVLTARPRPVVVLAGYSGSDFFDVDPYLRGVAADGVLSGGVFLWIDHRDQRPRMLSGKQAAESRRQLCWLHEGGADVHVLSVRTRTALTALASAWGIDAPATPRGQRTRWRQGIDVSERDRRRATLELFHLMGLHHEVADVLKELGGAVTPDEWGIAARSSWAAGRYRQAAMEWRRAHAGGDVASQVMRDERSGACDWVRGRYLRAYRTLRRALEQAATMPADEAGLELRIRVAETLGRVLVHMRRTPDTWIFSTRRRRRWVLEHLPDPDVPGRPLGTHLSAQVRSVRADLGEGAGTDPWTTAQAAFAEYESLNAQLNYRHAELRHVTGSDPVEARRFRMLRQDFLTIGADGDAARVPLIPGADVAFTILEAAAGLQRVDLTRWHRCRLLAGFVMRRIGHRFRSRWRPACR